MKAVIILIILSALGAVYLMSCSNFPKKGSGHVVTEEKTTAPFTKVNIKGIFPVEISQNGGKEFVKVETDKNLQDFITVTNDGDEVTISTKDDVNVNRSTKMKVYINVKDLRQLDFSSVGNLSSTNTLKLDSLELNSESVGKLRLDLEAKYLHANLNSVGATTFTGKVHEARINNKGVGTLSAFDLKTDTMRIHNTGIGSTEIYADQAFYIRSSSIGTLTYKGPGEVKELSSEGIGKVKKQD